MAEYITKIRTDEGDKQIDNRELAHKPTAQDLGAALENHTHTASEVGALPSNTFIPTKMSQLENDSDFKTTDNNTTYTLTKSGSTITLTGSDGSKTSVADADTNTTYTLSSFGITATAAELNYVDGVTSNIQTQLNGKANNHTHEYLPLSGGTVGPLTVNGNLILIEKVNYGTAAQRPSPGVKGRVYLQKVVT